MKLTPIVRWDEVDYSIIEKTELLPRKKGGNKSDNKWWYKDLVCAFDIETTYLEEIDRGIMYLWQFQIDEYYTVMGRTWNEYKDFMHCLCSRLAPEERLYIAVHNLSYEWSYLRGIYDFKTDEVFAIKNRKILHCSMMDERLQYFCSYKHSNQSLEKYCKSMMVEHSKLTGTFDYSKRRYPWTPLDKDELAYGQYDVVGLVEAIKNDLKFGKDTLYTFPMTSTGYVRRNVKNAVKRYGYDVKKILPDYETFVALEEAMRGGNTHANRHYVGRKIKNVKSADRKSSYPEVIENYRYPMSKFEKVENPTMETFAQMSSVRGKAVLARVAIWDIDLKDYKWPVPYISESKCRTMVNVSRETLDGATEIVKPVIDNGRVISAPYLETTITDVDMSIIIEEYKWSHIEIIDMWTSRYAMLPKCIRDECRKYFNDKCKLDGVQGMEYEYALSKALLNAIYGMFAQNPVNENLIFEDNEFKPDESKTRQQRYEEACSKAFLSYAWGVWVTAWARLELERGIRIAGEYTVYCDTDSVKYLDVPGISFEAYNKEKKELSFKNGAYGDLRDGTRMYMGIYEPDGQYDYFATWGSKKYCSVTDGKLKLTISGVGKNKSDPEKDGAHELAENGGIDRFVSNDFTFVKAGGLQARYYDGGEDYDYEVEPGKFVRITAGCFLVPSTYKMGISADYKRLLDGLKICA